jgi:predicted aspartyl protease
MFEMRHLLGVVCCLSLAAADVAQLRQLTEMKRLFLLRDALQQPTANGPETLYYRAVAEARFGHETVAVEDLRRFLETVPNPPLQRKSYEELASALVRLGRYGEAARAWAEALRVTPAEDDSRADTENTRALYESLRDVAPQTIRFDPEVPVQAKHNLLGSWDAPVEVNGHPAQWIFDTGANLSTLCESEAARIGLSPRDAGVYVKGSTEKKNPLRLAIAPDLHFGNAHLSNVIFLVLSDASLHIGPLKYQIRGILGLPVLRALGKARISAKGVVQIEPEGAAASGEPNLFFDGLDPIVETRHADHRLQMFLDTGANESSIYHSVRETLTRDEIGMLKRKRDKTAGAGGMVTRKIEMAPTLHLEILGRSIGLVNLTPLTSQPAGDARYRDGVIGMDALLGGFTLDFRAMQLRLE